MADELADNSSESRIDKILDSIDSFSKKIESTISHSRESKTSFSNESKDLTQVDSKSIVIESKESELIDLFERMVRRLGSILGYVSVNLQYLVPAVVIFQSALWLAYLSENSVSNGFISTIIEGLGDIGEIILRVFSILGAVVAYSMSSSFDSQQSFGTFSLHSIVADLIFILLILSSILYLMKKFESLYLLYSIFFISFIYRILDVNNFSYNWAVIGLVVIISIFFLSIVSIPIARNKILNDRKASKIDLSVLKQTSFTTEASYQKTNSDVLGSSMDQAPVTKPRRPSRRSEYELYEWVLLLANLILWPAVFFISIILGSGVEMYGNTYNMDENYLMLVGPLVLTLFFFGILHSMDKNARDGSLYAAEKQSYLEEMDKYLKARTSYLELVTLQAEAKKQEISQGSSEE
jgi:hypothetical protein